TIGRGGSPGLGVERSSNADADDVSVRAPQQIAALVQIAARIGIVEKFLELAVHEAVAVSIPVAFLLDSTEGVDDVPAQVHADNGPDDLDVSGCRLLGARFCLCQSW